MRIAVVNLTSGGMSGGYRKYLARLMPLMANDPRISSLTVFAPARAAVQIDGGVDLRAWARADTGKRFAALVHQVNATTPDVVFIPTARYARFGSTPVVTMVRNMEPLEVPFGGNTLKEGMRNVARGWVARRASRRAARVIAVSEHVRDFIVSRWHIDRSRVGLAYHGVDPAPLPAAGAIDRPPFRTLFTAGSIRPARGLEDAVRALGLIDADVRLVIGGRVDPGCEGYAARLRRLGDAAGVSQRIVYAGQLEATEMARAFRQASAFVMTSRAEACPNTVLEAMSAGCASVSVDRAPMPEFFGDAALYYPTGDASALAACVRALLASPAEQARLSRAAAGRATAFTWERTRDRTIQELEYARS